jgi:predicted enzyme related to lactoylglutathione lyase
MPVQGVGGLFFRAKDPEGLAAWYKTHLGVGPGCSADPSVPPDEGSWTTLGGPMAFAPFKSDTDYFAADKAFMINFRVTGLDAMLDQLRASGIEILTKPEWNSPDFGRFARLHDPEGNGIELWELPAPR